MPLWLTDYSSLWVMLGAVALERWLPLAVWYHPNTFLSLLFTRAKQRVYRPSQSNSYQHFAGTLLAILLFLICISLMLGVKLFAYYPEVFDFAVLYLLLEATPLERRAKRIQALITRNNKAAAKQLLAPFVRRDADVLSSMGLVKASIETLILRQARLYYAVLFWFAIGGIATALAYVLCQRIRLAFQTQSPPNTAFNHMINRVCSLFEAPPLWLFLTLGLLAGHAKLTFKLIKLYARHGYHFLSCALLAQFSALLQVQLGGPAKYQGVRFAKTRISTFRAPEAHHIHASIQLLGRMGMLFILILVGYLLVIS